MTYILFKRNVLLTNSFIVKDFRISSIWISATEFPNVEEAFPIDERQKFTQGKVSEDLFAQESRPGWSVMGPIKLQASFLSNFEGYINLKK